MPEPLESAWRRIAELEAEVSSLSQLVVVNERLVKANADLEVGILRLNQLVDELAAENAVLRSELKRQALAWRVDESAPPEPRR